MTEMMRTLQEAGSKVTVPQTWEQAVEAGAKDLKQKPLTARRTAAVNTGEPQDAA